jgi:hypothetical protein
MIDKTITKVEVELGREGMNGWPKFDVVGPLASGVGPAPYSSSGLD